VPLALWTARGAEEHPALVRIWNALGALDLVLAILLGALSAPGTPFRVFPEEPGTLAMSTLPWILVPGAVVPIYLLIHQTIAAKLRASARVHAAPTPQPT